MENKIKIAIADFPPLIIAEKGQHRGFEIDLWNAIAKEAKIDFEYETHSFKEIIPLLADKKIDVGLAGITINEDREKIIDFSHPTFESGLHILLSKNRKGIDFLETIKSLINNGLERLVKPLFVFLLITFIFANALWLTEKSSGSFAPTYLLGIIQSAWVSFGVIVGLLTGGSSTLFYEVHTWSGRVILTLGHITSLIVLGLFIGEITAFITTKKIKLDIEKPKDLQGKKVAIVAGTTSEDVLKGLGAAIVPAIKIEEAYQKLKKNEIEAVVFDAPVLVYYSLNEGLQWAEIAGELFNKQSYGIALQQESPLREEINTAFLRIKESGQYDLLYRKWFGEDLSMKS